MGVGDGGAARSATEPVSSALSSENKLHLGVCGDLKRRPISEPHYNFDLGRSASTRLRWRMSGAPAAASCHRQRAARAPCRGCCRRIAAARRAGRPWSQLVLEEVAAIGDQGVVGLLLEEIVRRSWRLAQPASRNGSLLGSKRDRKIAASIGSSSSSARRRGTDLRRTGRTCQRTKEGSP